MFWILPSFRSIAFGHSIPTFFTKCIINTCHVFCDTLLVQSTIEDYIRFNDSYDIWLLNPNWLVKPSIVFEKGIPLIMTCKDHNGGNSKLMVHPCRQLYHILSSERADQLCHAVIKGRTIKPMKASSYSNAFQMHEQRGTFTGIDTSSITNFEKYRFLLLPSTWKWMSFH